MSATRETVKVVLAEDSPLYVELFRDVFLYDPRIRLIGVAEDGHEAVDLVANLRPDVVVMDVRMPRMDGLTAVEEIMAETPTPILVITADPAAKTGELAFEALRRGALDLLPKLDDWDARHGRQCLCDQIVNLARVPVVAHLRRRRRPPLVTSPERPHPSSLPAASLPSIDARPLVGIVSSTGGPSALVELLSELPAHFPGCVLLVQHLSPGFAPHFVAWLNQNIPPSVYLGEAHTPLVPGAVFLAPDGMLMSVRENRIELATDHAPPADSRPGDVLLRSLATFATHTAGVVLTGMGDDGASGLLAMRRAGALTLAQNRESSAVYGMPRVAAESGAASEVLPLRAIAARLLDLAAGRSQGSWR